MFRSGLFARLLDLAARPQRQLRVAHFKELVAELGEVLSGVYRCTQVFEMVCLLSLQLTMKLAQYCPGVPEDDALEAVEWMALVMRNILDQVPHTISQAADGGASPFSSPDAVREWIADSRLWSVLLSRAGSKTQHHTHHLLSVLLAKKALIVYDVVAGFHSAGADDCIVSPVRGTRWSCAA
eukprot:NODE_15396_length_1052_cov_5.984865.p3 GENE.NODE_15396_length_1052_cov_5.984865~~NODE_15396_length_1052_cov_5.984865.p3  ORF type:complete len:182 (+),score=61.89 NODE_15396_length_1052_cov_5.984865:441-986(+)